MLINPRTCEGSAFYHLVLPPYLRTCCASDVSFDQGQSTRLCLGHFLLVGVSRFSRVNVGRRPFLGRVVRGPIIGAQHPGTSTMRRLHHCTSFVKADGRGSLLASASNDHHCVNIRIAKIVSIIHPISCRRLCTRTVTTLCRGRQC